MNFGDFDFGSAPGGDSLGGDPGSPENFLRYQARPLAGAQEPPYMKSLNDRQREAVMATHGPLIVLAGAGSGKTGMLTSRIAYLIDRCGVPPHGVLAVTFTNKAAAEMRERVERHLSAVELSGSGLGSPEIGTFHSICVRFLRRELTRTPFKKAFVIYDDSDQLSLIKGVVAKLGIDDKTFSPKSFQYAINRAKCDAIEPGDMAPAVHNIFDKKLKQVYEQYQKDLFANNAIDFGEIICMAFRVLRDNPDVRAKYQRIWKFIHVDEYQDTNRAQYLLLAMLAGARSGGHQNICVVGDEDQSIYKWRGADIRNILDFEKDYPGAYIVKLEQNYRSTKNIIRAASQVISNNRTRKDKTLWTDNDEGVPILRACLPDERAEAELVVSEVKRLAHEEGRQYSDFAIFYRTHAQSRQFEDVLRREKIPYQVLGGLRFYDRKEIKDIISYFKAILNPADSISMKRIINVPARGIGKTTIDKIEAIQADLESSGAEDRSFWGALKLVTSDSSRLGAGTTKKLAVFVAFMERLMMEQPKLLLSELYHLILDETGYVRELKKENTDESVARIENMEEFDSLLLEFEEDAFARVPENERAEKKKDLLPIFIEQSALASEADSADKQGLGATLKMMSLHSSKGLEFPVVFLVGMEEGLFPSVRAWEETPEEDIEEERRLCYVGMTRARERLYMLHASVRRIWGQVSYQEPARFFSELPLDLVQFQDYSQVASTGTSRLISQNRRDEYSQVVEYPTAPPGSEDLIGRYIQHPDYGMGKIALSEGSGPEQKVTIEFKGKDRRKFLLRYIRSYIEP